MRVNLVESTGGEHRIIEAAGVCRSKSLDKGIIQRLIKMGHMSPFEFVTVTFELHVPIFVARQIMRHRTFSYMEKSLRVKTDELEFYTPDINQRELVELTYSVSRDTYFKLLESGVAAEVARMVLPLATMTTFRMSGNLRNWLQFFEKRLHKGVQHETKEISAAMAALMYKVAPVTMTAFMEKLGNPDVVNKYLQEEV